MSQPVEQWYTVEFDSEQVRLRVSPPGGQPWVQAFHWADIERVCFKAEDFDLSDGIYIFTRRRPESYAVPIEADGGQQFWAEIIRRGLFDAELAIEVAASLGGVFCWPPDGAE